MISARERILIIEGDPASRKSLLDLLETAGYEVSATASPEEGFGAVRNLGFDLLFLDANLSELDCCQVLKEVKGSSAMEAIRVILLASGGAVERGRGLDLGADDVISRPWAPPEIVARVRAHLRVKRALDQLREKTRLAEEGHEIAHSAIEALAVTDRMSRDAFSLGRMLKIGATAFLVLAAMVIGILIFSSRRAEKETKRAYAVIAQLERGVARQQDLVAQSRNVREEIERPAAPAGDSGDAAGLRQQLAETSARLRRVEDEGRIAQHIIRSSVPSVCLLHVVVVFRDKASGQRLRYAGLDPQGEPLKDSEGKPIFTLTGQGPEVHANFFGTGFIAAGDGRILTNHHVVEPWWKNDELESVAQNGIEPVIAEMSAYFPGWSRAFPVEVRKVSPEADLAVVQGGLAGLKRPVLALDDSKGAAISGQPLISVGYATGLPGILARAGDETIEAIITATNGDPKQVLAELARRNLIRPVTTQGHIGDVLADKIIYDAQTTSGGSGGPLFNHHGKVIGVTFGVVEGFGGSNFGIPIRYAAPLLAPLAPEQELNR